MSKKLLLGVDALHYAPEATEMARDLCHDDQDKIIISITRPARSWSCPRASR